MPPEDEPQPTAQELESIRAWIASGAQSGSSAMTDLQVPVLPAAPDDQHYVSAAVIAANCLVLGKLGELEALELQANLSTAWKTTGLAGKVNAIRRSAEGAQLVVSSGIVGLRGDVYLIDALDGRITKHFTGHTDAVYCAMLSPDNRLLVSGSYDRSVLVRDVETGEVLHRLTGHNGAIYDLDIDREGRLLATASADQTIKIWNLNTGERLDTLGQPEGEMLCVRFAADGKAVFASGTDRQIRKWQVVSRDRPDINPMLIAKYAHEAEVLKLELASNGQLLSCSTDGVAKLWSTDGLTQLGTFEQISEVPSGLCVSETGAMAAALVGLHGELHLVSRHDWTELQRKTESLVASTSAPAGVTSTMDSTEPIVQAESEPNDRLSTATSIDLPAAVSGAIHAKVARQEDSVFSETDVDLFRFEARAGQEWLLEASAASEDSQVDTIIDVLDEQGRPVLRTRLQALRESYFTFRGKDSDNSDDFRLHKWEDMELDEYLYSNGEVNRLWLYPRGPDSGFKVYPGFGSRYTFFGSTPVSHALGEPAYVVRELGPDEAPLPNGLPVFPIYYENDDDGLRRSGKNSRLTFIAPHDGTYFARVRDARGFENESYRYQLAIRPPEPDFKITVSGNKLEVPHGSGREWQVAVERIDGLDGAISIEIEGLPPGFVATNPLVIEAGQQTAVGSLFALANPTANDEQPNGDAAAEGVEVVEPEEQASDEAEASEEPQVIKLNLIASSMANGTVIQRELDDQLEITVVDKSEVEVRLVDVADSNRELSQLTIRPGQTISARVVVHRNGEKSRIGFGKEDSGRNLPHGAFVDNIGLNGLLITEENADREFFITAAPKLRPGKRQFHLKSDTKGNPTSKPLWLIVE